MSPYLQHQRAVNRERQTRFRCSRQYQQRAEDERVRAKVAAMLLEGDGTVTAVLTDGSTMVVVLSGGRVKDWRMG